MNIFYEINIIVSLKTISIEWERVGYKQLIEEMEKNDYHMFNYNEAPDGKDLLFTQNYNYKAKKS